MKALRTIVTELVGLFVEDRIFALAIAVWLAISGALAATDATTPALRGAILFVGLAAILIGGIVRGARD